MKKLNVKIIDWSHHCSDRCCYDEGTDIVINGEKIPHKYGDLETVLKEVLEYLGHEVQIERIEDKGTIIKPCE